MPYTLHPIKPWSYWTEVHKMFTRCSQIIADEHFKIRSAILQSVSECHGDDRIGRFRQFWHKNWLPWKMRQCKPLPLLRSRVTGAKFTKFLHKVDRSSQIKVSKSELWYSTLFSNANATNDGDSADFAYFNPKIGCYGNVPWASGKKGSNR